MVQNTKNKAYELIYDYVNNAIGYNRWLEFLQTNFITSKLEGVLSESNYGDIFDRYFSNLTERINQDYQSENNVENPDKRDIKSFVDANYADEFSLSKMQEIFDSSEAMAVLRKDLFNKAVSELSKQEPNIDKGSLNAKITNLPLKELALSDNDINYFLEKYSDEKTKGKLNINRYLICQIIEGYIGEKWIDWSNDFLKEQGLSSLVADEVVPEELCDFRYFQHIIDDASNRFLEAQDSRTNNDVLSDDLENKVIIFFKENYPVEAIMKAMNDSFDRDSTILNIQSRIATEISEIPKYSNVSFNFWLEKITKITDLDILSALYGNEGNQEEYIEANMVDWKQEIEEEKKLQENNKLVASKLQNILKSKVDQAYENYIQENRLKESFVTPKNIPEMVLEEQVPLATEELLTRKEKDIDEENVEEVVNDYVNQNYTQQFLTSQIEYKFNEDSTRQNYVEDITTILKGIASYRAVNRSFWITQLTQVKSLSELASFDSEDGVINFVDKYVPDWEEATQ